jgi:4-coumarate--CoA ligase
MSVYRSIYLPPHIPTNLSFSQYLNTYNPDAVSDSKTILEDDWTGQSLTYQGIRDIAARHADALKAKLGLQDGDVVAICAPNSVWNFPETVGHGTDEIQVAHVQLIHAVLWAGGKTALVS